MCMLAANSQTEYREINEGVRERTEGAGGVPIEGTTVSDLPELLGTGPPTKEYTTLDAYMAEDGLVGHQ